MTDVQLFKCLFVTTLPSGDVVWVITLEAFFVVNTASWTASVLRDDAVTTDVELLAVVSMREGRVREDSAVGTRYVTLWTREPVGEAVCKQNTQW